MRIVFVLDSLTYIYTFRDYIQIRSTILVSTTKKLCRVEKRTSGIIIIIYKLRRYVYTNLIVLERLC